MKKAIHFAKGQKTQSPPPDPIGDYFKHIHFISSLPPLIVKDTEKSTE